MKYIRSACVATPTTCTWVSKEKYEEEEEKERVRAENKGKAHNLFSKIVDARKRYHNKCKDGKTFWELYNEDVEKLIYKEITWEEYIIPTISNLDFFKLF